MALLAVLVLATGACSRSNNSTASSNSSSNSSSAAASSSSSASATGFAVQPSSGPTELDQGGFGDLTDVCKAGDAKGATDVGVSDAEIHIGVVSDKGAQVRPGLNREMYDAGVAFAKWCNEHGGILGRKLVVDDRDAKLFSYTEAVNAACGTDLALVGGGAALDDDNGARVRCGLVNIAGFVVSPSARVAKVQVQPLPNPVYTFLAGPYRALDKAVPGALQNFGILTGGLPSTRIVRDGDVEAVENLGGKVVYSVEYNAAGEQNWQPFAEEMKSKGVKMFDFVGEPENLTNLQKAMNTIGYYPDVTVLTTNFYDSKYAKEGGATAKNTWVRSSFTPFELASTNKATQAYIDMMFRYNKDGKIASLGEQSMSSWLLFAKAATACGSTLTRACLLAKASAVTSWTGGGLHAATDPATSTPAQCFVLLKLENGAFAVDKAATAANQGIFNCGADNLMTLKKDYGVPR